MSTHVIGFKPPDEKWAAMKKIYDSCKEAGIHPPQEVNKFFDYQDPDPNGVEVEIPHSEWSDDMETGIEICIDKIPKDVKIVRFYNSF